MLSAAGSIVHSADVNIGLGHLPTQLRAGGEREPPARRPGSPRPVPTNQWYSSLFFERWPQPLYAQPGSYRATSDGFAIDRPIKEAANAPERDENDIVAMHRSTLSVLPDFALTGAKAGRISDWAVDVVTGDDTDAMTVTIAHGSPYSFHRLTRGDVTFRADAPLVPYERSSDGRAVAVDGRRQGLSACSHRAAAAGSSSPTAACGLVLPEGKRFFSVAVLPGTRRRRAGRVPQARLTPSSSTRARLRRRRQAQRRHHHLQP
jgi:hypothetical protein